MIEALMSRIQHDGIRSGGAPRVTVFGTIDPELDRLAKEAKNNEGGDAALDFWTGGNRQVDAPTPEHLMPGTLFGLRVATQVGIDVVLPEDTDTEKTEEE